MALGPLTLTLSHAGGTWYLGPRGGPPLEDTLVLPWEDLEVWAVRENDLLHLRPEARSGLRLYELLAEEGSSPTSFTRERTTPTSGS